MRESTPSFTPEIRRLSKPEKTKADRYLCFDLENRPLAYWYDGETTSEITAFSWKWEGAPFVDSMLLNKDGRFVCSWPGEAWGLPATELSAERAYSFFRDVLASADVVYGHNIRRHDLPILNAGLLRRQLPILPPLLTTDTLRDIPKRGGMSASLENLASYYGLEGEKLKMTQHMWEEANRLKPDGIDLARERVEGDVLLQESLRKKLLDLGILKAPRMWRP